MAKTLVPNRTTYKKLKSLAAEFNEYVKEIRLTVGLKPNYKLLGLLEEGDNDDRVVFTKSEVLQHPFTSALLGRLGYAKIPDRDYTVMKELKNYQTFTEEVRFYSKMKQSCTGHVAITRPDLLQGLMFGVGEDGKLELTQSGFYIDIATEMSDMATKRLEIMVSPNII